QVDEDRSGPQAAERGQGLLPRGVQQVADEDCDGVVNVLGGEPPEGRSQRRPAARFRAGQRVEERQQAVASPQPGRPPGEAGGELGLAHVIAAPQGDVAQRGGHLPGVLHFRRIADPHGRAVVDQQDQAAISLFGEHFDEEPVEPAVNVPVDVTVVVPRLVLAVVVKLDAAPRSLAAVFAGVRPGGLHGRIEAEPAQGADEFGGEKGRHRYTATSFLAWSTREAMSRSGSTPSASASKLRISRWRRAGAATRTTSSREALKRPSSSARPFAARTSAWAPLGLAP